MLRTKTSSANPHGSCQSAHAPNLVGGPDACRFPDPPPEMACTLRLGPRHVEEDWSAVRHRKLLPTSQVNALDRRAAAWPDGCGLIPPPNALTGEVGHHASRKSLPRTIDCHAFDTSRGNCPTDTTFGLDGTTQADKLLMTFACGMSAYATPTSRRTRQLPGKRHHATGTEYVTRRGQRPAD